jgi:peptide/nickel transport system substrate-binding protein
MSAKSDADPKVGLSGGTDRRAFLTRAGLLGIGALATGSPAGAAIHKASRGAASPRKGGNAVVALSIFNPNAHLDPAKASSDFDLMATGMLFDNLVNLDAGFTPHPALAESWHVSPNAQVWTFKLRKGVAFHDGSAFTADDVVYSLNRVLDPKTASPSQQGLALTLRVRGIRKVNKYTVQLILKRPNAFLLQLIGSYNLRIVKRGATANQLASKPIGTGPFRFSAYKAGELFQVRRNPNYWQSGLPYLDGIQVKAIPEQASKVQAVLSGDVDIADAVDIPTAIQLRGNSAVRLYTLKGAGFNVIAFQQNVAPFNDVRVRQALKMAFNRDQMLQVVFQGQGLLGLDIPIATDDPLFPTGFKSLPYDPEKAKSLLKQAGLSNGISFDLPAAEGAAAFMVQTDTAYQSFAKSAGVTVNIKSGSAATYWSESWMNKPAFSSFWLRVHPDTIINQACESKGVWNESQFSNSTFDKLVRAARATSDISKQKQYYAEAMPILANQSGWIVTGWGNRVWPAKKRLQGVELDFIDNADFRRAFIA